MRETKKYVLKQKITLRIVKQYNTSVLYVLKPQFLRTLEVRKTVDGYALLPENSVFLKSSL